jgi:hypothetical protein
MIGDHRSNINTTTREPESNSGQTFRGFFSFCGGLRHRGRRIVKSAAPLFVRRISHIQNQGTSVSDVRMTKPGSVEGMPIECCRPDVLVPRGNVVCNDYKLSPVTHPDGGFRKDGAPDLIHGSSWTNRIEPHGTQDIPG